MQVQLIVKNKSNNGEAISVGVPAFRIGRAEDCHLRSKSSQISPQHCVLYTHDGTVTVQDLGGETGTFVNGERIVSQQVLQDGDELAIGRHLFVLSIKTDVNKTDVKQPVASSPETFALASDAVAKPKAVFEREAEIMFEVRHKGQNVSVTKQRLFDMARKGAVLPDDVISVAGTKVFADSIQGIVFGKESPASPETTSSERQHSDAYAISIPVAVSSQNDDTNPFDITNEPSAQVDRVPGARKEMTFSDLGKPLEEPLEQASSWVRNNVSSRITSHHVLGVGFGIVILCLFGFLVYWFMPEEKSLYGAIRITGMLTLDGMPVSEATVTLHPHDGNEDHVAVGRTNMRGVFRVTTGADPPGRGAVPGEYNVTFEKRGEIPPEYKKPDTSGQSITVELNGKNNFTFGLTTETSSTPPPDAPSPPPPRPNTEPAAVTDRSVTLTNPDTKDTPLPPPLRPVYRDIFDAATRGTAQDVERFVTRNPESVNEEDSGGNTPLHIAARSNPDEDTLKYFVSLRTESNVSRRVNVNAVNNAGQTPLDVVEGSAEKRDVLNQAGAQSGPARFRDICEAAAGGTVQDIEFFIKNKGIAVNAKNDTGNTPLHFAARFNPRVDVLNFLISEGADGYAKNNGGGTPWDVASGEKKNILREALSPPPSSISDIFDAAQWGTVNDVFFFLTRGVNVNQSDTNGRTPLHLSALRSNPDAEIVRLLLERGAGPSIPARCHDGWTPLHEAAGHAGLTAVRYLVERGAEIDVLDPNLGRTPLHCAAISNSDGAVLGYLVEKGAILNRRDKHGETPLHLAAKFNSEEVLRYLVSLPQIETRPENTNGKTPLDVASTEAKKQILKALP